LGGRTSPRWLGSQMSPERLQPASLLLSLRYANLFMRRVSTYSRGTLLCRRTHNTRTSTISTAQCAKLCHNARWAGHHPTSTGRSDQRGKMMIISVHNNHNNNLIIENESNCRILVLPRSLTPGPRLWLRYHLELRLQFQVRMSRGLVHHLIMLLLRPRKAGELLRGREIGKERN
jgi:hypothetical protein